MQLNKREEGKSGHLSHYNSSPSLHEPRAWKALKILWTVP